MQRWQLFLQRPYRELNTFTKSTVHDPATRADLDRDEDTVSIYWVTFLTFNLVVRGEALVGMFQLTDLFLMHPFSTPWKHYKTVRFSDISEGGERGSIGNKWVN